MNMPAHTNQNPFAVSAPQTQAMSTKALSDNGFKVSLHYQENQFVDIGLVIGW